MTDEENGLKLDFEDEVLAGACVARDGKAL